MIDHPCPETFTWQNSTFTRDRHHGQVGFEPTFPASEQPQTDPALDDVFVLGVVRETEQTWTGLVRDLYHHTRHYCSTILSHTADCCGRYKWIWIVSCIPSNVSHIPYCKLAQVVALSSPPFTVKLSVWLPSSCNAVPLIAEATTQHKEVAFHQPIKRYQILCCYRVSGPGLLNVQRMRESVWMCKAQAGATSALHAEFPNNWPLTFRSDRGFTATWSFPQLPKRKTHINNGHTRCICLAYHKTVDTWRADEYLELANYWGGGVGDIRNENILTVFPRKIIWNFLTKKFCKNVINILLPPPPRINVACFA